MTPQQEQPPRTLTQTLLLTFALPDFYAEDLGAEVADFYDGDLTEAFYEEAGLISSTARLCIMSGDKGGNDLHSMRAVLIRADVVNRVSAHDEPEDERLTEALAATPSPSSGLDERLDLHDELVSAEHEVAARLHRYLWGDTPHQDEPDDGSDCQTCWDETNGLLFGTILNAVADEYKGARLQEQER